MKASVLYRIASVLLLLFAIGHTLGFCKIDPKWGVDSLIASMRTIHFDAQGFSRSYWDFYTGFGLFVTVFLLFAAFLAWQLGGFPAQTLTGMRGITWAFALCFVAAVRAVSYAAQSRTGLYHLSADLIASSEPSAVRLGKMR